MIKRAWPTALVATFVATSAMADECTCTKYPFGSTSSCVDICGARLINTAPFSDIFSVLKLPVEAQNEILAQETTANDPDSLASYSEPTQDAIRSGLAGADPAALEKLFAEEK